HPTFPLFPYTTLFRSASCYTFPNNGRHFGGGRDSAARAFQSGRGVRDRQGAAVRPALVGDRISRAGRRENAGRTANLPPGRRRRSEEHTSELQSRGHL